MNTPELVEFIKNEEIRGSEILNDLYIQRYRRFSDPVALIILTIIGYAISSRKSRGGTALQIGLGVVISIVYIALLLAGILFVGQLPRLDCGLDSQYFIFPNLTSAFKACP